MALVAFHKKHIRRRAWIGSACSANAPSDAPGQPATAPCATQRALLVVGSMLAPTAAAARSSGSNWRGGGVGCRRSSAQAGKCRSVNSATVGRGAEEGAGRGECVGPHCSEGESTVASPPWQHLTATQCNYCTRLVRTSPKPTPASSPLLLTRAVGQKHHLLHHLVGLPHLRASRQRAEMVVSGE